MNVLMLLGTEQEAGFNATRTRKRTEQSRKICRGSQPGKDQAFR